MPDNGIRPPRRPHSTSLSPDLVALAADLAAAEHRWLLMVAEFDRREGWAGAGVVSCAHWLSWRLGLSPEAAREKVRVARALTQLPKISEAFGKGELSYSRARAVTRAATPENEELLVDIARHSTGAQLERIVRATVGVQDLEQANQRRSRRSVTWRWDTDGSLILRARLDPEEGAAVLAAIEAAQRPDPAQPSLPEAAATEATADEPTADEPTADEPTADEPADEPAAAAVVEEHEAPQAVSPEQRMASRADGMVAMAEAYIGTRATVSGADVYQVVLHVRDDAAPHLEDGPVIPVQTALRLTCDASLYCIHQNSAGAVLDVGRTTRTIPSALRKALRVRDGGCRFPGCTQRRRVDAHHVIHWTSYGRTALGNLVLLCRRHHRLVHEDGFGVVITPDGHPVFSTPDGKPLPERPPTPCSEHSLRHWHEEWPDQGAIESRWAGEPMDLGYVTSVITRVQQRAPAA